MSRAACISGVMSPSTMRVVGSPGSSRSRKKVDVIAIHTVRTAFSARLSTKRTTGDPSFPSGWGYLTGVTWASEYAVTMPSRSDGDGTKPVNLLAL